MNTRVCWSTGIPACTARRTTPGPQSTNYPRPPLTTSDVGPTRFESGFGVPVPSITTRVSCAHTPAASRRNSENRGMLHCRLILMWRLAGIGVLLAFTAGAADNALTAQEKAEG